MRAGGQEVRHPVPGRARQRHGDLESLQQPVLARALFRRRQGADPRPSFRRRQIRASRSATIRRLLTEAGAKNLPDPLDDAAGAGVGAPADTANVASPETYVGYARAENFVSPGAFARDAKKTTRFPKSLTLNQWALGGRWQVRARARARSMRAPGRIAFRFKARDLHLVLGPATPGKPVRFRVTLGGAPPKTDAGMDVDAERQRRGARAPALPAHSREGAGERTGVRHRIPRSGRRRLFIHVRLSARSS